MTIHTIILQGILNIPIGVRTLTKIRSFSNVLFFLSLILTLSLTGCGGGGGSDGTPYTGGGGGGNSVTISWDAPTTNEDGSPLSDLAGYKAYYGSLSGIYTKTINVGLNKTIMVDNVPDGSWCFAVTAYDTSGNESNYSDEVCASL